MAVAFRSSASTAFANAATSVVTKPSGLAVGDLMIAQFSAESGAYTYTPPTGFTLIDTITGGANRASKIYYKVADSSDVAASNFTFTITGGPGQCSANIMAFSGASVPQPVYSNSKVVNASSVLSIPTISVLANSILVQCMVTSTGGTSSASGYAIATSNPTWTEAWDANVSAVISHASAYSAVRAASTDTGAGSITIASGTALTGGALMLSIPPDQSISTSDTVTSSEVRTLNLNFIATDTITSSDSVTGVISRVWTKLARNIKSWTNQDR
ncbi:MAG: hypothetical protein JKY89_01365 [Immundisolibacteraceae bacterium]|nr:hypothetical protein [Immundisolibacteraceae bacterium]